MTYRKQTMEEIGAFSKHEGTSQQEHSLLHVTETQLIGDM